jgi:hypothetical protein
MEVYKSETAEILRHLMPIVMRFRSVPVLRQTTLN